MNKDLQRGLHYWNMFDAVARKVESRANARGVASCKVTAWESKVCNRDTAYPSTASIPDRTC